MLAFNTNESIPLFQATLRGLTPQLGVHRLFQEQNGVHALQNTHLLILQAVNHTTFSSIMGRRVDVTQRPSVFPRSGHIRTIIWMDMVSQMLTNKDFMQDLQSSFILATIALR